MILICPCHLRVTQVGTSVPLAFGELIRNAASWTPIPGLLYLNTHFNKISLGFRTHYSLRSAGLNHFPCITTDHFCCCSNNQLHPFFLTESDSSQMGKCEHSKAVVFCETFASETPEELFKIQFMTSQLLICLQEL